ncbi:type I-F CRISPR-associated protein Csy1 [Shewanella sp. SR44-3]|uniref:type I-F CRISPR-associated protein Csy1 n=1 Tax=Shewanella sp. SR44-3 TaxID=2760936 RepID=UPI0015FBDB0C|nr:type I-F CRISPR-associated protein Csy1 [Shewanella sp. SR44-3]MBB1270222.1 type I-F CRISPR-associated protein Csy1 [Shewanella sp. SR44-3]
MELTLSDAIADYIEQRKQAKLEPLQKARDKLFENIDDLTQRSIATAQYNEAAAPIEAAFNPVDWLTDAAKRAKQISLATHAAKFTHSDAKASSMLVTDTHTDSCGYITTASLSNKAIDAVGNAAALDVAKLLKISVNNESLITQLQDKHINALKAFTDDEILLNEWQAGFEKALGDEKLSGHTLIKQLYYPIHSDAMSEPQYHLLCPLFSSSLAHELHKQITKTRFGEAKEIRDARKKGHFHTELSESFPATAVQNFGGSKPQNISQLNSERYGQSFLLNCAPPTYQAQSKPPLASTSVFNRDFSFKTSALIREFKAFLAGLTVQDRNFKTRYKRDYSFVQPLLDSLFNHAAQIQSLTEHAGWSNDQDCQMKHQHALWLDAYNPQPSFQSEREKGDWLEVVAHDFSLWLLRKLENKQQYLLGDVEQKYFKKLCLHELKAFERHTPKLGEH